MLYPPTIVKRPPVKFEGSPNMTIMELFNEVFNPLEAIQMGTAPELPPPKRPKHYRPPQSHPFTARRSHKQ